MKKENNNLNAVFDTELKKYLLYSFLYDQNLILALLKEFLGVEYKKEDRRMFVYDKADVNKAELDAIGVTRIEADGFRRELCGLKYLHDESGNSFLLAERYKIREDSNHNLTCENVKAVAIYLKIDDTAATKEEVNVSIEAPNRLSVSYKVPCEKITDYSMAELIEKKLYVLIPFYFYSVGKKQFITGSGTFEELGNLYDTVLMQMKEAVIDGNFPLDIMDFVRERNDKVMARLAYECGKRAGENLKTE